MTAGDWISVAGRRIRRELLANGNIRVHFPSGTSEDWRPLVGQDFVADPARADREFMEFRGSFYEPAPEARRSQEENDTE